MGASLGGDSVTSTSNDKGPEQTGECAGLMEDRERVLNLLEDGILEAHRKVEQGRVYDVDNEKIRIKWIRALAYATNIYRQTLKDHELENMSARLQDLEKRVNG